MPLPLLENNPERINITDIGIQETKQSSSVFKPEKIITENIWTKLVLALDAFLDQKEIEQAIHIAGPLATMFPEKKYQLQPEDIVFEPTLIRYIDILQNQNDLMPYDKNLTRRKLLEYLALSRPLFPQRVNAVVAASRELLDDIGHLLSEPENLWRNSISAWEPVAHWCLAVGCPPSEFPHKLPTTHHLVVAVKQLHNDKDMWHDDTKYKTFLEAILPMRLFAPNHIPDIQIPAAATKLVENYLYDVLYGQPSRYSEKVFSLCALGAETVTVTNNGLQMTFAEELTTSDQKSPPTRRTF